MFFFIKEEEWYISLILDEASMKKCRITVTFGSAIVAKNIFYKVTNLIQTVKHDENNNISQYNEKIIIIFVSLLLLHIITLITTYLLPTLFILIIIL